MTIRYDFSDPNVFFVRETEKGSMHDRLASVNDATLGKHRVYLNNEEWKLYEQYKTREMFEELLGGSADKDAETYREIFGYGEYIDPDASRSYDDIKWEETDNGADGRIRFANGYVLYLCKIQGEDGVKVLSVAERRTARRLPLDVIPNAEKEGFATQKNYSVEQINRLIEIIKNLKGSYYSDGHPPVTFVVREDDSEKVEHKTSSRQEAKETQNILTERERNMTNSTDKKKESHKIVVNNCYGGFRLSEEAIAYLEKQPEIIELRKQNDIRDLNMYFAHEIESRTNPALIRCVEMLGKRASAPYATELVVETFEGDKYNISEYDGMETVETPKDIYWLSIKSNKKSSENSARKNTSKEKNERLDLLKMSVLEKSVQQGRTRPAALRELYEFTQKDTTAVVLSVAIMHAQEMSFYPKGPDKEAVNPVLVPYVCKVMKGALYNPNSDLNVVEISSHTLDIFAENHFEKEWDQKVQDEIKELVGDLKKNNDKNKAQNLQNIDLNTARVECATFYMGARGMDIEKDDKGNALPVPRGKQNNSTSNRRNIDLDTARVECATFYMGARGMDLVRDDKGNSLLLPRGKDGDDLSSRIKAEMERRSALQDKPQKFGQRPVEIAERDR